MGRLPCLSMQSHLSAPCFTPSADGAWGRQAGLCLHAPSCELLKHMPHEQAQPLPVGTSPGTPAAAKVIASCTSRPSSRGHSAPGRSCAPSTTRMSHMAAASGPVKAEQPLNMRGQRGHTPLQPVQTPGKAGQQQQQLAASLGCPGNWPAGFATPRLSQVGLQCAGPCWICGAHFTDMLTWADADLYTSSHASLHASLLVCPGCVRVHCISAFS